MKKIKTMFAAMLLCGASLAHADMDFAIGMVTGLSTGSAGNLIGAMIHNANESVSEDNTEMRTEGNVQIIIVPTNHVASHLIMANNTIQSSHESQVNLDMSESFDLQAMFWKMLFYSFALLCLIGFIFYAKKNKME